MNLSTQAIGQPKHLSMAGRSITFVRFVEHDPLACFFCKALLTTKDTKGTKGGKINFMISI